MPVTRIGPWCKNCSLYPAIDEGICRRCSLLSRLTGTPASPSGIERKTEFIAALPAGSPEFDGELRNWLGAE